MGRFLEMATLAALMCLAVAMSAEARQIDQPGPDPSLILLNESNWRLTLKDEWLLKFHAPWCPACRSLVPSWNEFASTAKDIGISVGQVDVTTAPGLSGRFFVTALPTIFHVKDGVFRQYRGPRDPRSLRNMIEERQWGNLEEISAWKHPDSIQMSVISHFFTLSHFLKEINDYLQVTYNFPVWLAYALFAIFTIFLGAVIGLIFVCIVDVLVPPRRLGRRKTFAELQKDPCFEDYPNEDFETVESAEESTSEDEKYSGTDTEEEETKTDDKPTGTKPKSDDTAGEKSAGDETPKLTAAGKKKQSKKSAGGVESARDSPKITSETPRKQRNKSRKAD